MTDKLRQKRIEAIDILFGVRRASMPLESAREPEGGTGEPIDIDNLAGLPLIYHFCKTFTKNVVGSPESAFAWFNEYAGTIHVVTKDMKFVEIDAHPWHETHIGALEGVQTAATSFHVSDGAVTCVLKDVMAQGCSLPEAAMRAWLKKSTQGLANTR